ncbi:hypothetical protein CSKR_103244 [Clonorchis sinensis]|uniref:Uncharacterized protein n=1 Tax=Clonorchis sinensis TaxID=79923 RepID=A0A419PDE5_CLOSI|nr:hypothetical protein CSKR_103244 [Clonorchis sinensis]
MDVVFKGSILCLETSQTRDSAGFHLIVNSLVPVDFTYTSGTSVVEDLKMSRILRPSLYMRPLKSNEMPFWCHKWRKLAEAISAFEVCAFALSVTLLSELMQLPLCILLHDFAICGRKAHAEGLDDFGQLFQQRLRLLLSLKSDDNVVRKILVSKVPAQTYLNTGIPETLQYLLYCLISNESEQKHGEWIPVSDITHCRKVLENS